MAIPTNPSRSRIKQEFGGSTLNAQAPNGGLAGMYASVFSSSNYSRDAFGGKEKATNTTNMSVSITDQTVTLSAGIIAGGVNTEFIGQYQLTNGNATPVSGNWSTLASTTTSTDGTKSVSGTLSAGEYFFRIVVYNGFISHSGDRLTVNSGDATDRWTVQQPVTTLNTPVISSATAQYNGVDGYISFTYSDDEDYFNVQVRIDGSTTETALIDCTKNVGTTNSSKEIRFGWNTFPNSSIEFRVRAGSNSQYVNNSAYSSWKTASSVSLFNLPSCPL